MASANGAGDPEVLSLRSLSTTPAPAAAMKAQHSRTLGHPPTAKPRKPVPTPRNTLRKPLKPARRQADQDSQGQTSVDSTSPDDESAGYGSKSCSISGRKCSTGGGDRGADGEDILAALEKIPGVGSLRRASSSVGSSLPSLNMDGVAGQQRLRRDEESSHSLGVQQSAATTTAVNGQQSSELKTPSVLKDAMMMMKRSRISSTSSTAATTRKPSGGGASAASSSSSPSPRSPSTSCGTAGSASKKAALYINRTKVLKFSEDEISVATDDRDDEEEGDARSSAATPKPKRESMLARPLPELPLVADCRKPETRKTSSPAAEEDVEEGVYSTLLSPDHYSELKDATSAKPGDATSLLMATSSSRGGKRGGGGGINYLTMTGTMRKKRREVSVYDVQMSLTPEGLAKIERKARDKYHDRCFCGLRRGLHVFVLSLLAVPFAWVYATLSAFYTGTLTWYNVFAHYNEDRGCCLKLLSPLVLLAYPLWIVPVTLALGLYGAGAQVSWYYDSWSMSLAAPDGGFFYWACDAVGLGECAPYQVILISSLHDLDSDRPPTGATEL